MYVSAHPLGKICSLSVWLRYEGILVAFHTGLILAG